LPLTGGQPLTILPNTAEDQALIEEEDHDALKELSQHTFMNAFYTVMFGAHNTTGIHGACAIDILHTIYLGLFLRVRDCFSYKLGRRLLVRMSLMPLEYGELFARQSDRNMPKSKFNVGITGGKLMAKEYEGVLLLLATIVRSSAGRKIPQDTNQGLNDDQIADWLLLLETLLGWVQWLKSEKMQVKHVDFRVETSIYHVLVKSYP
jgi:hypothetical protein